MLLLPGVESVWVEPLMAVEPVVGVELLAGFVPAWVDPWEEVELSVRLATAAGVVHVSAKAESLVRMELLVTVQLAPEALLIPVMRPRISVTRETPRMLAR